MAVTENVSILNFILTLYYSDDKFDLQKLHFFNYELSSIPYN